MLALGEEELIIRASIERSGYPARKAEQATRSKAVPERSGSGRRR